MSDYPEATSANLAPEGNVVSYDCLSIVLHWLTAAFVLIMLGLGWWMTHLIHIAAGSVHAFALYKLHKSLGFLVLMLALARLAWRVLRPAPPSLPAAMPNWEQMVARWVHALFYLLLLIIPLVGWLYISTEWAEAFDKEFGGETRFFDLFSIPYIGPVVDAPIGLRRTLSFHLSGLHEFLAYALLVLVLLHGAAALKHQLLEGDGVLATMIPWLAKGEQGKAKAIRRDNRRGYPSSWLLACATIVLLALVGWQLRQPPQHTRAHTDAHAALMDRPHAANNAADAPTGASSRRTNTISSHAS